MKVIKSRWLMSILAVFMAFGVLAGCSSGSSDKKSSGKSSKELEIQYFVGGYGDAWWKKVIKDFEAKHPDIHIKQDAGPKINDKMKTRWISGNPPDVVYIDGAGASETQMVDDDQLMDLTDWFKSLKTPDGDSLKDSLIMQPSNYDGKIYSLPLIFDTWGIWYDKGLFEKKGYDVPKDFESWMASMKKIKQDGKMTPFITTGKYPYYFLRGVLYPAFASAGGEKLLNDVIDGKEGAWKDPKVQKILKNVKKMVDAGYVDSGFGGLTHTQSQADFLQNKDAYIPDGYWLPAEMKEDTPEGFKFGFTPTPMNEKGQKAVLVPDLRPVAIAKKAKNPKAAKEFVKFVFQKKYAKKFSELSGALINLKDVDLKNDDKAPDYLKTSSEMINTGKVDTVVKNHPMSADMENPIGDNLVSFLLGKMSVDQFTKKAEDISAKYRSNK